MINEAFFMWRSGVVSLVPRPVSCHIFAGYKTLKNDILPVFRFNTLKSNKYLFHPHLQPTVECIASCMWKDKKEILGLLQI